jgi:serine phosphatase RsbU (regulator of sigma subunit)
MTVVTPCLGRLTRWLRSKFRRPSERAVLISAVLALLLGTGWSILDASRHLEVAAVSVIVVVLASLALNLRAMLILVLAVVLCLALVVEVHSVQLSQLTKSALLTLLVAALVGVLQGRRRDLLGLRQVSAETVLGLIRDRQLVQAQLPTMPAGWNLEIQQRPAHGAAISGDFVANRLVCEGTSQVLHLAVVDVAGSGITAGPRALLLSGAVGGLLGSVPAEQFLSATNDYLARQQWSLGLASAVYLRLDLTTGQYSIRSAGHPPALHYRPVQAGDRWRTSQAAGTVLGVLPVLTGVLEEDVLRPGEALFLYTDGVVETRAHDIDTGTQRLKDNVEALGGVRNGDGLAPLLIDRTPGNGHDDRTLVLIERRNLPQQPRSSRAAPKQLWHSHQQADKPAVSVR